MSSMYSVRTPASTSSSSSFTPIPTITASRVLFILKQRDQATDYNSYTYASGLGNSALFIVDMLLASGVQAWIVSVVDNNDIDRAVSQYKPTDVIIEALWVVPSKFVVLRKLHPGVRWIVRLHSELTFIASEGVALEWLFGYVAQENVCIAGNAKTATHDFRSLMHDGFPDLSEESLAEKVLYLPNYYPLNFTANPQKVLTASTSATPLNICCFSAIRPLKNQLVQAAAAIHFARSRNRKLNFHINGTRVEQAGENILKNLRALFKASGTGNKLVEHPWMSHADLISLLPSFDAGMQASLTETFNIVAADMASVGLPMVVSWEIGWASIGSKVQATSLESIAAGLDRVTSWPGSERIARHNQARLLEFCRQSRAVWEEEFQAEEVR